MAVVESNATTANDIREYPAAINVTSRLKPSLLNCDHRIGISCYMSQTLSHARAELWRWVAETSVDFIQEEEKKMTEHQKETAQKQVQKRYQLELTRYQKQIEKRNKVLRRGKAE